MESQPYEKNRAMQQQGNQATQLADAAAGRATAAAPSWTCSPMPTHWRVQQTYLASAASY